MQFQVFEMYLNWVILYQTDTSLWQTLGARYSLFVLTGFQLNRTVFLQILWLPVSVQLKFQKKHLKYRNLTRLDRTFGVGLVIIEFDKISNYMYQPFHCCKQVSKIAPWEAPENTQAVCKVWVQSPIWPWVELWLTFFHRTVHRQPDVTIIKPLRFKYSSLSMFYLGAKNNPRTFQ